VRTGGTEQWRLWDDDLFSGEIDFAHVCGQYPYHVSNFEVLHSQFSFQI